MKIGPDGSLCRITSSATEHNNAMILAVPESDSEKSNGPPYKLFIIGAIQNPCESSEAESDEELDEKVPKAIESNIENGEKANSISDKKTEVNEAKVKEIPKGNRGYKRYHSKSFKNRRSNNQYTSHNQHNSSSKRNSYHQNSSTKSFSNPLSANAVVIDPWMRNPNQMMFQNYQYPVYPPAPAIEPRLMNQLSCESSPGLLGSGPRLSFPPQFPPQNPNVPEQNFWNDGIVMNDQDYWNDETVRQDQNYWNNDHSNSYQRPVSTDRPVSKPENFQHRQYFHQNRYRKWGNKGGNAGRWKKSNSPKKRRTNTRHYNYDHRI